MLSRCPLWGRSLWKWHWRSVGLYRLRTAAGLTQEQLAFEAELQRNYANTLEHL